MKKIRTLILLIIFAIGASSCAGKKNIEGDRLYEQGQYVNALRAYDKYLKVYPRNTKTLYNRARTQEKLGNIDLATQDLNTVLELDPDHLQARITLGDIEYGLGDYEKALYEFDKAVNSHKQNSIAYTYRAKANQKMSKFSKAYSDYEIAIRLDTNNGLAYLYRGTLNVYQKRHSKACIDFKRAKKLGMVEAETALQKYCTK